MTSRMGDYPREQGKGTMPRGNNYLEDIAEPHESAVPTQAGIVKGTRARSYRERSGAGT